MYTVTEEAVFPNRFPFISLINYLLMAHSILVSLSFSLIISLMHISPPSVNFVVFPYLFSPSHLLPWLGCVYSLSEHHAKDLLGPKDLSWQ